jgi:mannose-1-phosphate guanylyltransferase
MEGRLWSVILAGGAGTRLVGLTGGVPKQFWKPGGGPSLLEQTLARIRTLTPPERCVIVIDEAHREHIGHCALGGAHVVAQPTNRGTAAGVLYGLLAVLSREPQAVVLITPADHGVLDPSLFLSAIQKGVRHVTLRDGVMLFGVAPSMAHTDHGWIAIAPGETATAVQRVVGFFEKPSPGTAEHLLRLGSLLNTMIIAGRALTLLQLCRDRVPDLTPCFVGALTLPPDVRDKTVRARYPNLPSCTPDRVASWLASRREPLQEPRRPPRVTPSPLAAKQSGRTASVAS